MQIQVFNASTIREIDAAFAALANDRPDALFVGVSPFLLERRVQLAQLAARHMIPAIYQDREHTEVGGLMSYGASIGDAYRLLGVYAGRILKGAKPADLPVVQSSKFELVITLLAQSGHSTTEFRGPLLGVKRTLRGPNAKSTYDPERTSSDLAGRKSVHAILLTAKIAQQFLASAHEPWRVELAIRPVGITRRP